MITNFKVKLARSKPYLRFIANQPCSVPGCSYNVGTVHHVETGGMGTKCSDYETVCLCLAHHREIHQIGKTTFSEKYKVDLLSLAKKLFSAYGTNIVGKGKCHDMPSL